MRITNGMVANNILLSLNRNKLALSISEQQLATGKKIQRPSDDPIVAVRALKFRANVREVEQYKSNAKDALSWMDVTSNSITNIIDIVKKTREISVQGSTDTINVNQRKSIISSIKQLKEQLSSEGNVDYAGRHVFTGFKTDKPLTFTKANTESYKITEKFGKDNIENVKKIINETPPANPRTIEVNRIRLGYSEAKGLSTIPNIVAGTANLTVVTKKSTDNNAYEPNEGTAYMLEDTGELIINSTDKDKITSSFEFSYNKQGFKKGDLNPIHYFKCETIGVTPKVTYDNSRDSIDYQVSYNQKVKINTLGKDLVTVDLMRDLEEIINEVEKVTGDKTKYDDLLRDALGKKFSKLIGKVDKHKDSLLQQEANLGTRTNRMNLTINRLEDDKVNFTNLLATNEDIDISEVVVKMKSQEMVYNAALMASAKIMKSSLLDFVR